MTLIDELKHDAAGLAAFSDWIGNDRVPADEFAARHRASVCLSCPRNKPGNWWEVVKSTIANAIRRQLSVKHKLNLTVPDEHKLGTCDVCGCCLPLLVWCPTETVLEHTVEPASAYPVHCWKLPILEP